MEKVIVRTQYRDYVKHGTLTPRVSADGTRVLRWYIDFKHELLHVHRELSAPEVFMLQHKVDALMQQWDERTAVQQRKNSIFAGKYEAEQQTIEAAAKLESLSAILAYTLKVNDRVDWAALKDFRRFSERMTFPQEAPTRIAEMEPVFTAPRITFWDKLFGKAGTKLANAAAYHQERTRLWQESEREALEKLRSRTAAWTAAKAEFESKMEAKKRAFEETQTATNAKVDLLSANVAIGEQQAVIEHAMLVLEASNYGDLFDKSFDVQYDKNAKTLLVEYRLPSPDDLPKLKSVRFVSATGEMKESFISEREQKANYDSVCYQICLRTIHELFEADEFGNLEAVLFNGFAEFVDRSTGKDVTALIMSIMVKRAEFEAVDLARVDPKQCFKSLKGVSASALAALAPVAPVMKLNKEDRRFIDGRATAEHVDDSTNLAAMDWEDFEHLVREVFEKEFQRRGGEVKITQASSDGGVDAVAFDPDPLTGGKIIIQAKRYTRTVGVAAVRDLYGTMQHERASRGILVTTSDYGPDAYEFANGKHIALLTGANLLHLLNTHGIRAKIDIREARRELKLRGYDA